MKRLLFLAIPAAALLLTSCGDCDAAEMAFCERVKKEDMLSVGYIEFKTLQEDCGMNEAQDMHNSIWVDVNLGPPPHPYEYRDIPCPYPYKDED